ncbi:MAG TPA: hypothetical protein VFY71_15065 [Planctomycetota bacterium]|nr:hypothetical protein [Planctomycetota bacterium]
MKRLLLALAVFVTALLVAEGAASLFLDRSLLRPYHVPGADEPGPWLDHPDPLVGYTLRPEASLEILGGRVESDALGMRRRPGPPPAPDALRLLVVGDSVAFGFGLDDDQTLACRLEALLADVRRPGDPPVACFTVALPGWNHRNAVHFVLDHIDELDPDLVIYVPVANDLNDMDVMDQLGRRRLAPDPAQADPWLFAPSARVELFRAHFGDATPAGATAMLSDLSPESARRYDDNVASIAALRHALLHRGCRLVVAMYRYGQYATVLQERLQARLPDLPVVPLFARLPAELTLGFDPHPGPRAQEIMARWLAEYLLGVRWVPGDASALPAVAPADTALRALHYPPADVAEQARLVRAAQREALLPVVDFRDGTGVAQVYGGLNVDGTCGPQLLALLAPGPQGRLAVTLGCLGGRPDMLGLRVAVEVDGQAVGELVLQADEATGEWPLPGRADPQAPFELRLVPERWIARTHGSEPFIAAFVPLRLQAL